MYWSAYTTIVCTPLVDTIFQHIFVSSTTLCSPFHKYSLTIGYCRYRNNLFSFHISNILGWKCSLFLLLTHHRFFIISKNTSFLHCLFCHTCFFPFLSFVSCTDILLGGIVVAFVNRYLIWNVLVSATVVLCVHHG